MDFDIMERSIGEVESLAAVPMAFRVDRIFEPIGRDTSPAEFVITERRVEKPWVKDYDRIPGEGPGSWARLFDISKWGLIVARTPDGLVGATVIAFDTPAVPILEGRSDIAALWDFRVSPQARGIGRVFITYKGNIGSARTIQKNGGILESEYQIPGHPDLMQSYFIDQ